jgi:hypothetical protein
MNKSFRTAKLFSALALLLAAREAGAQGYAGWSHHRNITLNTTSAGAGVTANVDKFPLPINLSAANFDFSQANADGSDLRFSKTDGSVLPYQIEAWDKAAQTAAVWVKVDVKGNDATQAIAMHWGNTGATSESDGTKVFDKADGWIGDWHLAEKGSTTAGGYKDATANAAHGSGINITGDATAPGRVGPAVNLNRANKEYVLINGSETSPLFNPLPSKGTFSIWANSKSHPADYIAMFAKGETGFRIHFFGSGTQTEPCIDVAGYDWCMPSKTKHENNKWYHYLIVIDKPGMWYYANGALDKTEKDEGSWKTLGAEPVTIGNNESKPGTNNRNRSFDGMLDEARILSIPKDANWVKLDYESQREGSTLLKFEPVTAVFRPQSLPGYLRLGKSGSIYDLRGRLISGFGPLAPGDYLGYLPVSATK